MRKIALPTLAALALALGACGGGATQDEEPAGADEAPAVADGVTGDAVEAGADSAAEADSADAVATPTPTPSPTPDVAASAPASPSPAVTPAVAAAVTAPPAFALCRACHSTEAGQNGIGPELEEGLGLLRTEELLAARRLDGARQYFTRAYDYGFSRDAEEAFRHWPRDSLLADVVAVPSIGREAFGVGGGDWADVSLIPDQVSVSTRVEFVPAS